MTTIELAVEIHVTPKSVRQAINRGKLRATRQRKGREQAVFTISRADADAWIRWRAERRAQRVRLAKGQKGARQDPQAEHFGYFPNKDDERMDQDKIERLKRAALNGDEKAKARLQLPWEEGGAGLKIWLRAGIGAPS